MRRLKNAYTTLKRYPTAVGGVVIIAVLIGLSIYAVVTVPYGRAIFLWRGSEDVWAENPKYAAPVWFNLFRSNKLPETIVVKTADVPYAEKEQEVISSSIAKTTTTLQFEYPYEYFPTDEVNVFFEGDYSTRAPQVSLTWITPDGREIPLKTTKAKKGGRYAIATDRELQRTVFGGVRPSIGLFADPATLHDPEPIVLKGTYKLRVEMTTFEEGSSADAKLVVYGKVSGLAGTDHRRRDLTVALLWGAPIALSFGLIAAVGTTAIAFVIAGIGTWYGGWIDAAIQRITEVNMQLPFLPILILVGTFYSKSIWVMLAVIIALSIFSASIKSYRAMFLGVKNSPYIEAARAYGAGNWRIIIRYMIPRIAPVLIPSFVIAIPSYVFLEASLAVLGLGDPTLPTWGKMLNDAYEKGALYKGYYYWVLEPAIFLVVTGLAFSMLGFALDRVFNPRLRGL